MNPETETPFVDDGTQLIDLLRHYTVVCPDCDGAANVSITGKEDFILFASRRLTCSSCGYTKMWASQGITYPGPDESIDWYFRAPYFFQKRCAGHQLWVANRAHLEFLRSYVAAKHRTRKRGANGWTNKSIASRIPKWIADAKNRTTVLRTLDDLEMMMNKKANQSPHPTRTQRAGLI